MTTLLILSFLLYPLIHLFTSFVACISVNMNLLQMQMLILTFLGQCQIREYANTQNFIESFEDFGLKLVIRVVIMSTWRFVSRSGLSSVRLA